MTRRLLMGFFCNLAPLVALAAAPSPPSGAAAVAAASNASVPAMAVPEAQANVLARILETVKTAFSKQEQPTVLFDLDATLFDTRPRVLQILHEFGEQELRQVRPEAAQKLAGLTLAGVHPILTETLRAAGITEEAVQNNAAVFWSQRYFADDYLRYDKPVNGAVAWVRALYSAGARIVYLTGRDAPRQLLGTVRQLRDHGYPVGIQSCELIMRPTLQTADAVFKQQAINYLRHFAKVVATFDTEAAHANVLRRAFPDATVVLLAGSHKDAAETPLPNIEILQKFE